MGVGKMRGWRGETHEEEEAVVPGRGDAGWDRPEVFLCLCNGSLFPMAACEARACLCFSHCLLCRLFLLTPLLIIT